MDARAVVTISRDVGCMIVGLAGIAHQELLGRENIVLLMVYLVILGVPGALSLFHLLPGKPDVQRTPEPLPSSPPSSSSSPPS